MLRRLTRNPGKDDGDKAELASLRGQIDQIDDELMTLIQRRMEVAREIGIYKKSHSMTVVQPDRYENLITRRVAEAESLGLSPDFILPRHILPRSGHTVSESRIVEDASGQLCGVTTVVFRLQVLLYR